MDPTLHKSPFKNSTGLNFLIGSQEDYMEGMSIFESETSISTLHFLFIEFKEIC